MYSKKENISFINVAACKNGETSLICVKLVSMWLDYSFINIFSSPSCFLETLKCTRYRVEFRTLSYTKNVVIRNTSLVHYVVCRYWILFHHKTIRYKEASFGIIELIIVTLKFEYH